MAPMLGSIVIPAWNEATTIAATLHALFDENEDDDPLEVVVACNGCTDDTVALALESGTPITVLDLPAIGKAAAIREAETALSVLPRLYLDADVILPGRSARAVLRALADGAVAARPPVHFDSERAGWVVRRYFRQRSRLAGVNSDLCGAGVYGLSAAARRRFSEFPDLVADDLFAARIVRPDEVLIVDCDPVVVAVPLDVRSLVRTLGRSTRGNRELLESMSGVDSTTRRTALQLICSVTRASDLVDVVIYASIVMLGRVASLRAPKSWARDETSRMTHGSGLEASVDR